MEAFSIRFKGGICNMVKKQACENGVTIVCEPMSHFRSVSLGIWVKAGSMDECIEEAGMAHFIEHMLFKGTNTRTARKIAEEFDQIGGDVNAFTSKDSTCFYVTVLSEHAEKALAILADMLFNSLFDQKEMEKEKLVILEEIATVNDTPDDEVDERLWTSMYGDQPVGRPILGEEKTIQTFTEESIRLFMNRTYTPHNLVVSVAGKYDDSLITYVSQLFSAMANEEVTTEKVLVKSEFQTEVSLKAKDVEQTHLSLGFPGISSADKRIYELAVLDSIIGSSMSSRLFQEVREERGLAYSIFSYYTSYADTGTFIFYGGTSPEKTNELYETMIQVIQSVVTDGVTESEVQNAKEQIKGGFLLGLEDTESRMARNGRNELLLREHKTIEEVVSLIEQVEKSSVENIAQQLLAHKHAISIIAPKETIHSLTFV